ncbi:hypothetical protein [Roseateles sp.]
MTMSQHAMLLPAQGKACADFAPLSTQLASVHERLKTAFNPGGLYPNL